MQRHAGDAKATLARRKQEYLDHLDSQPEQILLVSLADKLFNARAIRRDYISEGEELWLRFKGKHDPRTLEKVREDQLWYYEELATRFGQPECRCPHGQGTRGCRRRTRIAGGTDRAVCGEPLSDDPRAHMSDALACRCVVYRRRLIPLGTQEAGWPKEG